MSPKIVFFIGCQLIFSKAKFTSLRKNIFVLLSFTICFQISFSQQLSKPIYTIFCIGDAGKKSIEEISFKDTLQFQIRNCSTPSVVIFTGDNIYPDGMHLKGEGGREADEKILEAQISLALPQKTNHEIIFVPGNHDWDEGRTDGITHIEAAKKWIDELSLENLHALPYNGCPGPIEFSAGDGVVFILLDTQWFLQKGEHTCQTSNFEKVFYQIDSLLEKNKNKMVIVAAHHPMLTYGSHGGVFSWKQHIFPLTDVNRSLYIPLPVLGSLYPLYRKFFGSVQDVASPRYKAMRRALTKVLENHRGTIYLSGHEHALEYAFKNGVHYVVSGSGVNSTFVKKKGSAKFVSSEHGFARIILFNDGSSEVEFFSGDSENKVHSVYKQLLNPCVKF
jgi:predicted phosphodiesterase